MSIIVVDSIMGSGKSSWAIDYMNRNLNTRYIYIAQYLDEAHRIMQSCPECRFCEPFDLPTKQHNFKKLIQQDRSIVTTHALFSQLCLSEREIQDIRSKQYTIIIDETVETVDVFKVSKGDMQNLFDAGLIEKNDDGYVRITERGRTRGENKYKEVLRYVSAGSVFMHNDTCLMWILPPVLFELSEDFFILTYLFNASHMKHTLNIYGYEYQVCHVQKEGDRYNLIPGMNDFTEKRNNIRENLIHLCEDEDKNDIGKGLFNLSHAAWEKKSKADRQIIANAARSYFRSGITRTALHVEDCMWSVFKDIKDTITVKDYDRAWCPYNLRAMNNYRNCYALAYLVNVFEHPTILNWFETKGEMLDTEAYSLSILIQWIWRSSIRDGRPIHLFLPSKRMRDLLNNWLNG